MTLATIPEQAEVRQGQLVSNPAAIDPAGHPGERSRPPDDAAATCHAVTGPTIPAARTGPAVTAAVAAPTAASTSAHGFRHRRVHPGQPGQHREMDPDRLEPGAPHRRNQPRTVLTTVRPAIPRSGGGPGRTHVPSTPHRSARRRPPDRSGRGPDRLPRNTLLSAAGIRPVRWPGCPRQAPGRCRLLALRASGRRCRGRRGVRGRRWVW